MVEEGGKADCAVGMRYVSVVTDAQISTSTGDWEEKKVQIYNAFMT